RKPQTRSLRPRASQSPMRSTVSGTTSAAPRALSEETGELPLPAAIAPDLRDELAAIEAARAEEAEAAREAERSREIAVAKRNGGNGHAASSAPPGRAVARASERQHHDGGDGHAHAHEDENMHVHGNALGHGHENAHAHENSHDH